MLSFQMKNGVNSEKDTNIEALEHSSDKQVQDDFMDEANDLNVDAENDDIIFIKSNLNSNSIPIGNENIKKESSSPSSLQFSIPSEFSHGELDDLERKCVRVKRSGVEKSCFLRFYLRDGRIFKHSTSPISYFVPCDQKLQIFIYSQFLQNFYLKGLSMTGKQNQLPWIDWNYEVFEIIPTFLYPKRMVALCLQCFEEYKKGQSLLMFDHLLKHFRHEENVVMHSSHGNKKRMEKQQESEDTCEHCLPPHDLIHSLIFNRRRLKRMMEPHWTVPKIKHTENSSKAIRVAAYIERLYLYLKHLFAEKEYSKAETICNSMLLLFATHGQYFSKKISGYFPAMWMEREELLITHTKVGMANAFMRGHTSLLEKTLTSKSGARAFTNTKVFSDQAHLTSALQVAFFLFRFVKEEKSFALLNKLTLSWVFSSFCQGYHDILSTRHSETYNGIELETFEKLLFRLPGFIHNHDFLDFICECALRQSRIPLVREYYARFYEHAPDDIYAKIKYMKALMCLFKEEEKHVIVALALEIIEQDPLSTIAEKVFNQFCLENTKPAIKVSLNTNQVLVIMKSEWKCVERDFELDSPWRLLVKCVLYCCKSFSSNYLKDLIHEFREFTYPAIEFMDMCTVLVNHLKKRVKSPSNKSSEKKKDQHMLLILFTIGFTPNDKQDNGCLSHADFAFLKDELWSSYEDRAYARACEAMERALRVEDV
ncbi:hypothetical protein C9374_009541 [Naegleria lovaniensis]|uniref:Uncharacterized protein n=1 Tax=Naegleria lovaniensis TaxID=51637 RepID=A0AA88KRT2_NAELO|nr:uncharacterized protein C9374_009541 [Naegleria lovaniensis]KAG2392964.1 hypothetical protein C9374_009541 [Naegleria lovaniensis]